MITKKQFGVVAAIAVASILMQAYPALAAFFSQNFNPGTLATNLSAPIISLPSATTTGSVASSTIYFEVVAVDAAGTQTTVSNQLATTTLSNAGWNITWNAIAGATGYNVYFSTTTPATFAQYFAATTSNQFDFTSTSSPTYATPPTANSAEVVKFGTTGSSYVYGGNGTATTTVTASSTALQVNGNFVSEAPATTTNCYTQTAGVIFFNTSNNHEWGCDGTNWNKIF